MKEATIESIKEKPLTFWKRILVPIDFSDLSKEAIKIAICLAQQCRAKITLLHVAQLSGAESIETGTAACAVLESARRSLDEIAREIPAPLLSQKLVCFSAIGISQKIVETARDLSSDLIVLGTHAYGFFKRALVGGTAESVNHHPPCEVLVVRQKPKN